VSEADEIQARAIVEQYDDKDFSLTDATCFAIMQRLAIPRAFTLDRNFSQYGIEVIPMG
jgi:predicted nucleic acid-binding protein